MEEKNDSVHAECPKHQGQPEIACVECRVEEKESTEVKYIDVKVFREAGFLKNSIDNSYILWDWHWKSK